MYQVALFAKKNDNSAAGWPFNVGKNVHGDGDAKTDFELGNCGQA